MGTYRRGKKGRISGLWEKARPGYPAIPAPMLPPVEIYNRYTLLENEGEMSDADSPLMLGPVSQATGPTLERERRQKRSKRTDRKRQRPDESNQSKGTISEKGLPETTTYRQGVTPAPRLAARPLRYQTDKMERCEGRPQADSPYHSA